MAFLGRAFIADRAVGQGLGVGGEQGAGHIGAVEQPGAQHVTQSVAEPGRDHVTQQAEILVAVGEAGARHELQAARSADQGACLLGAEHALSRGAAEHGGGPVVTQAGLVMRQMQGAGVRAFQAGKAGGDIGVQRRGVGEGVEHGANHELLGDGADAEQCLPCERDAPFCVGPAPAPLLQHLAVTQHHRRSAGTGEAGGQRVERLGQACLRTRQDRRPSMTASRAPRPALRSPG